jgi:hypothetical protein
MLNCIKTIAHSERFIAKTMDVKPRLFIKTYKHMIKDVFGKLLSVIINVVTKSKDKIWKGIGKSVSFNLLSAPIMI